MSSARWLWLRQGATQPLVGLEETGLGMNDLQSKDFFLPGQMGAQTTG